MSIICVADGVFLFKQKTAYEMRISDWSSDVCSSDLTRSHFRQRVFGGMAQSFEVRDIEEPGIAFDGVDKAKDCIETRGIFGIGFPGDKLTFARFQHLARFRDEFSPQVIHCPQSPETAPTLCRMMVNESSPETTKIGKAAGRER